MHLDIGETRRLLEDRDTIILRIHCEQDGLRRIGWRVHCAPCRRQCKLVVFLQHLDGGRMLITFSVLLICQCLGEGIAFLLHLPIPGPVIGMLILFCALVLRPALLATIQASGDALLQHLSLLFVPAGVGIFAAAATLRGQWLAIVVAVVTSTLITLAVTALVMRAVSPVAPDDDIDASAVHE